MGLVISIFLAYHFLTQYNNVKRPNLYLQQYTAVPETPLLTTQVLKDQNEQWPEVQQEMTNALNEMRVNDKPFTVKNPNTSSSKLIEKRRRNKAGTAAAAAAGGMAPIDESSMSVE